MPIILSLCDHSGSWSAPFLAAGYKVVRIDPKHGVVNYEQRGLTASAEGTGTWTKMPDGGWGVALSTAALLVMLQKNPHYFKEEVEGILMAPPCTDFAGSGARHWAAKDADGRTSQSIQIVRQCLAIKDILKPKWWVLENPVGRVARLVPEVGPRRMTFHPHEFAGLAPEPEKDQYTKRTCLYGEFNTNLPKAPLPPIIVTSKSGKVKGSWMFVMLGGKSEKTKELRSVTPKGFAKAFSIAQLEATLE